MSQLDDDFDRWCRFDEEFDEPADTHVRCKFCSKSAWWRYKDGWKLYNTDGTQHLCRIKPASVDEFEDVS